MPILSIITVCFNAAEELKNTFNSFLQQIDIKNADIEYLIIDNNSEDNTTNVISWFEESLKESRVILRYVRESDKGIYDAMNKGIALANGEWVILLNAGDTFYKNSTVHDLFPFLVSTADVLVGSYNRLDPSGNNIVMPPEVKRIKDRMVFCHQALIFRGVMHKNYFYNLNYHIAADYDAVLRMYLDDKRFEYTNVCIVNYDVTGVSAKRMIQTHREIYKIRNDNNAIDNKLKAFMIYNYGLVKRVILQKMPQNVRWAIVGFRNRHFGRKYI